MNPISDISNEYKYLLERFQLREAQNNEFDFDAYFRIKCDKLAIEYSGFTSAPDRDVFKGVYDRIFKSKEQYLYFLIDTEKENEICASFHLKKNNEQTVESLGYNVFPQYRGMHIGYIFKCKINELFKEKGFKFFLSLVAESNTASIKNLEKTGAKPDGTYEMRELKAFNRTERFLHYITEL